MNGSPRATPFESVSTHSTSSVVLLGPALASQRIVTGSPTKAAQLSSTSPTSMKPLPQSTCLSTMTSQTSTSQTSSAERVTVCVEFSTSQVTVTSLTTLDVRPGTLQVMIST